MFGWAEVKVKGNDDAGLKKADWPEAGFPARGHFFFFFFTEN